MRNASAEGSKPALHSMVKIRSSLRPAESDLDGPPRFLRMEGCQDIPQRRPARS